MQQKLPPDQSKDAQKPKETPAAKEQPKGVQYNLAKSMVSGAVKKLSYLGTSGISMPSIPKIGWYQKKKPQEETKEEFKEESKLETEETKDTVNLQENSQESLGEQKEPK